MLKLYMFYSRVSVKVRDPFFRSYVRGLYFFAFANEFYSTVEGDHNRNASRIKSR